MHDKIQNDAFRTLATDGNFKERVDEASLIRVLDAFVWQYLGEYTSESRLTSQLTSRIPGSRRCHNDLKKGGFVQLRPGNECSTRPISLRHA
jgi:hypothetical protein